MLIITTLLTFLVCGSSLLTIPSSIYLQAVKLEAKSQTMTSKSDRILLKMQSDQTTFQQKTGIILIDHGSKRKEANDMLLDVCYSCCQYNYNLCVSMIVQVVARFKQRTHYKIVEAAHMELSEPSIYTAYRSCIEQGATRIVCHPYFLSYGKHVQDDIPSLLAEAAESFPNIEYTISSPLGAQDGITALIINAVESAL
jgi:sirohydrochlorin ferrochelatase